MWKHIFGYANIRFWLRKDTGAMNQPLRLTDCSQPISWVFCVYFVGERCIIATRQQCCCNAFRIHSRNVRNVFVICVLHIRRVKVWFLRCKSMVFGMQLINENEEKSKLV